MFNSYYLPSYNHNVVINIPFLNYQINASYSSYSCLWKERKWWSKRLCLGPRNGYPLGEKFE